MNINSPEDQCWQNLVALSAPTYAAEATPPYGFVTRLTAQLRSERQERELTDRISLRALFAALTVLVLAAGMSLTVSYVQRDDLEPGLHSMVQLESFQVS